MMRTYPHTTFHRTRTPSPLVVERVAESYGISLTPDEVVKVQQSCLTTTIPLDQYLDRLMAAIQEGRG